MQMEPDAQFTETDIAYASRLGIDISPDPEATKKMLELTQYHNDILSSATHAQADSISKLMRQLEEAEAGRKRWFVACCFVAACWMALIAQNRGWIPQ
jgi:hypothetical protein